jgi:hypothetical protein
VRLLMHPCQRGLGGVPGAAPDWLAEETLSASQRIGDDRPAVWSNEN